MKNFFGALFLLAAVVFLYKAGVLMPDLAAAFGNLRYSYDPSYAPYDSLNIGYNERSYYDAYSGGYNYASPSYSYGYEPEPYYYNNSPAYGYERSYNYARPAVYSGVRPRICYTSHMPIIDGVNYNYPIVCSEAPSYSLPTTPYPAPTVSPTRYPSYGASYPYPSYAPAQTSNPQTCYVK